MRQLRLVPGLAAIAFAACLSFASAANADVVFPTVNCVSWTPSSDVLFTNWGYAADLTGNDDGELFVPTGFDPGNFISPAPADRDQTVLFFPGVVPRSWSTSFSPSQTPSVTWNLQGLTATASADSPDCHSPNSAPDSVGGVRVVGAPQVGQPLFAATGEWLGDVASIDVKWQLETTPGVWEDILGANALTFTPTQDQLGKQLRTELTAHSRSASTTVDSGPSDAVQPAPTPPTPPASAFRLSRSLNFGQAYVGFTDLRLQSIDVTNTGGTPMTFAGYLKGGANPADFDVVSFCGTVQPQKSCHVTVAFAPSAIGSRSATLAVQDTGGLSSPTVNLAGTGVKPPHR
jgi:HYDIN/CFA65/VesB-like, Ig-like domain